MAQSPPVHTHRAGVPPRATQLRWQDPASPAGRLAHQVLARQMNLPPDQGPGAQAALYDLPNAQKLLLIQGAPFSGASATGFGIFIGGPAGFREAGAVTGSRSDSIPVTLVPVRGGYPTLRVGVTEPFAYNPNLSMAAQRYRVIDHLLHYDGATRRYLDRACPVHSCGPAIPGRD